MLNMHGPMPQSLVTWWSRFFTMNSLDENIILMDHVMLIRHDFLSSQRNWGEFNPNVKLFTLGYFRTFLGRIDFLLNFCSDGKSKMIALQLSKVSMNSQKNSPILLICTFCHLDWSMMPRETMDHFWQGPLPQKDLERDLSKPSKFHPMHMFNSLSNWPITATRFLFRRKSENFWKIFLGKFLTNIRSLNDSSIPGRSNWNRPQLYDWNVRIRRSNGSWCKYFFNHSPINRHTELDFWEHFSMPTEN